MERVSALLKYAPYVVVALSLLEFLFLELTRQAARDRKESMANFGIWLGNRPLTFLATGGVFLGVLMPLSHLTPLAIPTTWWSVVLTLVMADFTYYWAHRTAHTVRVFWAYHSVHHSSKEYNLSTAVRLPWFGAFGDVLFYIPAVLLGFSPVLLAVGKTVVLLYQYWIHTDRVGYLGWFDRVFNSPSNHRVHHGSNPVYLDKNHAGILVLWDRLFGTYQAELAEVPVIFGLTKPLHSYNPVTINLHEPLALLHDIRRSRSLSEAVAYAFKGPGWQPTAAGPASSPAGAAAG